MARLLINFGTPEACEIPLSSGLNRLGRDITNDYSIDDPSISAAHCQILVAGESVVVTDLGSTNGTFIDSLPVREGSLHSGQTLRLGNVELLFDADTPDEMTAPPPIPVAKLVAAEPEVASAPVIEGPIICKNHKKSQAKMQCKQCQVLFCELCVTTRRAAGAVRKFCRDCGGECDWLSAVLLAEPTDNRTFFQMLPGAFKYPFQGDGWMLMAVGTLFYMFVEFVMAAARFAFLAKGALLMVFIFAYGYMFAYQMRIIAATVEGRAQMPDWPDFTSMEDVSRPFFQCLSTVLVSFLPGTVAIVLFRDEDWGRGLGLTILAMGGLYLPMAFLAVSLFDTVEVLNPLFIIPSIARVLREYLVACSLLAVIVVLHILVKFVLGKFMTMMVIPDCISGFLGLYFLTVEMRILGLLYYSNKERLGWFRLHG